MCNVTTVQTHAITIGEWRTFVPTQVHLGFKIRRRSNLESSRAGRFHWSKWPSAEYVDDTTLTSTMGRLSRVQLDNKMPVAFGNVKALQLLHCHTLQEDSILCGLAVQS